MTIEPYDVYKYYMAMKLHFESDSYDAVKYNFKTSAKPQSFFKRRDKYHFAKLGRKFDSTKELVDFFVSQFTAADGTAWVGNMLNDEEKYTDWCKRVQSLTYTFENDINTLADKVDSFDELFGFDDGSPYPIVISAYMQDEITLETVVILDKLTGFMDVANKRVTDTIVWPDIRKKILKYRTFLHFNDSKVKKIIFRVFTS